MNPDPIVIFSHAGCKRSVQAAGANGLVLYSALCAVAPPDGSPFVTNYAALAKDCGLTNRTVSRVLPHLASAGIVDIERVERDDLRKLGYVWARMPEIPPDALRKAHREHQAWTKGAQS